MAKMEHDRSSFAVHASWDSIRVFTCVVQQGSLRAAADTLNLSINSVRRKIEQLESEVDTLLLIRSTKGVALTDEGREIYSIGLEMLEYAVAIGRLPARRARALSGKIKLGVTEGLGTYWIAPHIGQFFEQNPNLHIDLRCEMRVQDISQLEVDLSIQLDPPTDSNLIVSRLGYLHVGLFATQKYLNEFGEPKSYADIPAGRFVHIAANQIPSKELSRHVTSSVPDEFVNLTCNTSSSHFLAITNGIGIGALPTYTLTFTDKLHHVLPDYHLRRDIWLVRHPHFNHTKRARTIIRWIKEIFDARKNPWFGEHYHPPAELKKLPMRTPQTNVEIA